MNARQGGGRPGVVSTGSPAVVPSSRLHAQEPPCSLGQEASHVKYPLPV
jgi:hypothetical protein